MGSSTRSPLFIASDRESAQKSVDANLPIVDGGITIQRFLNAGLVGGLLASIYGYLFSTLQAEDLALLLGSETTKVLTHTKIAVLVYR